MTLPKTTFCKLSSEDFKLPMPDRGGRLFGIEGEEVDAENPFYALCLKQGDIVKSSRPKADDKKPTAKK